jgi:hypothetical protein
MIWKEELGIDGITKLKWILGKRNESVKSGFMWSKVETSGGFL